MAISIESVRSKFTLLAQEKEKTRQREMAALRKTGYAFERTKTAEKKSFYLEHRLSALECRLFTVNFKTERAIGQVECLKKTRLASELGSKATEEILTAEIATLQNISSQYALENSELLKQSENMESRLNHLEERFRIATESITRLEDKLENLREELAVADMQQRCDKEREVSQLRFMAKLHKGVNAAEARYARACAEGQRLTIIVRQLNNSLLTQRLINENVESEVGKRLTDSEYADLV